MQHTRGYTSHSPKDNSGSVATLQARANLSEYIVFPKTYSFPRTVRILAIVRKFINAFRKKWDPKYVAPFKPTLPISWSKVPTAHQASRFTDVTNNILPDDGLEMLVTLTRLKNLTTVDVITIIAAFKRGLLDHWDAHGHLPLAIQYAPFEEDAPAGLSPLA